MGKAQGPGSSFSRWYAKLADFNVESLFSRKREPGPKRSVYVNEPLPDEYRDHKGRVKKEHTYVTNQVISSKYTIITFLPRNILEQFRRVAICAFFLGIAILQFFRIFSTISPGLVILPLLIVLGITAVKDGYEDIKRHQSDRQVNSTGILVLDDAEWENPNAMQAKESSLIHSLPSLSWLLSIPRWTKAVPEDPEKANAPLEPTAHFDTPQQSRRNSLHRMFSQSTTKTSQWREGSWEDVRVGDFVKIRDNEAIPADVLICATSEDENVAYVETKNLDGETNLKSRHAVPSLTHLRSADDCMNNANSFRVDCDRPETNMYRFNATVVDAKGQTPVDLQMTLLRGTVLRNTRWVIGLVVFTGEDTKIVLNSGGTPSKRSKVERQMNPQVLLNLLLLALMAVACAIADSSIEKDLYPKGAPWLYGDDKSDDNPRVNGLITWAFALITFQNIVPISLYISIEFVRTCQAAFIYFDAEMVYEKTGQPTLARSWNLSDDLGQIQYIFSDKTGTLTQNSMIFRQCSIGGKAYYGDPDADITDDEKVTAAPLPPAVDSDEKQRQYHRTSNNEQRPSSGESSTMNPSHAEHDDHALKVPNPSTAPGVKLAGNVLHHFRDDELSGDLHAAVDAENGSQGSTHARALNGFFSVLALCHTVLTTADPETGAIEYKAQSPDEAALVQAAADMGYIFRGRDKEVLTLQTPFSEDFERYELLNILEFTSARKRMSVVLRKLDDEDNRLFLLTKGADNVIFERLKAGGEELKRQTEKHLDDFASHGLRTLTLAYKILPEDEYEAWSEVYQEASVALDDREEKIEAACEALEYDLRLLGATAIEDKLQDGVPECIADLKLAGIKIWVATGDKLETAIAIGHSTNLISPESNIIVIRGGGEGSRPVQQQMMAAAEEFFPDSGILDEFGELTESKSPNPREGVSPRALQRVNTGVSIIVGADNGDRPGGFVLVIDGTALGYAFADDRNKDLLLRLAMQCEGVICCRVSPLQKALVVKMVKYGLGTMTLAIGDGANDVSMIQAADVGVGISGEEGLQAVNSADYAVGQFRFLKRLLLVHGHWSYARNGNMIVNFFYKNIICIGILWWYQIYCGWSSAYAFEYTYLLWWNSFFTIAPVIAIGLFDRIADDHVMMALPELYRHGRDGKWFNMGLFSIYMLDGIVQSVIVFFIIYYAYGQAPTVRADGWANYQYEFTTTMVVAAVMAANLFNGLNTRVWTGWVFFAILLGIVLVWGYSAIYTTIAPGWFYTPVFGNYIFLFRSPTFWFGVLLTTLLCLVPRYVFKALKFGYFPDDFDIVQFMQKVDPNRNYDDCRQPSSRLKQLRRTPSRASLASRAGSVASAHRPMMDPRVSSRTDMATGMRSVNRGFDFATEENGVSMRRIQTNLSERRASSRHLPQTHKPKRDSTLSHVFSLRRLRKRPTSGPKTDS
ncbi:hypothetical protein BD626DRAFT_508768 [Schizophyllum amplum]|uniref:Phospholipid-transporting ATPase n=1 Tax=Schizophyllum amplum TaxID=97359 RepID=A0A550C379_9AGAR|nr:hypothetical protein BD626DRAFT_508768 [Auriculariopsis ampla]